jgi:hypothetical protein
MRILIKFSITIFLSKSHTGQQLITKFQSSYPPEVSIHAYLERIKKYARCSDSCFVVALIYIDRMIEIRNVVLTSLNVHRLIITRYLSFYDKSLCSNNHMEHPVVIFIWNMYLYFVHYFVRIYS